MQKVKSQSFGEMLGKHMDWSSMVIIQIKNASFPNTYICVLNESRQKTQSENLLLETSALVNWREFLAQNIKTLT